MDDNIARVCRVGEDRVRLDNLLGKAIVESFEEERAQARPCASGDRMQHHEALKTVSVGTRNRYRTVAAALCHLERVTTVRLAINHLHQVFAERLSALVPVTPVVGGAPAIFADVEILRVVDVLVRARLDAVDNL